MFQNFGYILEVRCQPDKGFCFFKFATHESAAAAIFRMTGQVINGRPLKCSWGKEKSNPTAPMMPPGPPQMMPLVYGAPPMPGQYPPMYGAPAPYYDPHHQHHHLHHAAPPQQAPPPYGYDYYHQNPHYNYGQYYQQ